MTAAGKQGALALLCAAGSMLGAAQAASLAAILPPPGLYQIDSTASHAIAGTQVVVEQDVDGASGDRVSRTRVPGRTHSMRSPGADRSTYCVKPHSPGAMAQAALLDELAGCPQQSQKFVGKDALVHSAQCPGSKSTVTIKKLDSRTWEFESHVETLPVRGSLDLGHLRPALEHEARHGATAEKRREAAARLKELPAAQREMEAQRSAMAAEFNAALARAKTPEEREMFRKGLASLDTGFGPAGTIATSRARWTRIGNQCKQAGASH